MSTHAKDVEGLLTFCVVARTDGIIASFTGMFVRAFFFFSYYFSMITIHYGTVTEEFRFFA